jgi:hypothetical protein
LFQPYYNLNTRDHLFVGHQSPSWMGSAA